MAGVRVDVYWARWPAALAVCLALAAPAFGQVAASPANITPTPKTRVPIGSPRVTAESGPSGVLDTLVEQKVVEVRVIGNRSISTAKVLQAIGTKIDRPFDQATLEKDVRKLATKGWFLDVRTQRESVPGGVQITFEVVERPTLEYVKYLGNQKFKDKRLAKQTELKRGSPLNPYDVEEGRRKMEEYYRSKGYNDIQITILEGTQPGDKGAIYLIDEGQSQKVWTVKFVGNSITSGSRLKTQIQSKPPLLYLIKGQVDRKKIDEDVDKLIAYYRSLGFFRARIGREFEFDEEQKWLTLTFVIDEGPRYKVRNVSFVGNRKFSNEQLTPTVTMKQNEFFDQGRLNKDLQVLQDMYGSEGYVFANVQRDLRFLEEPGQLDVVFSFDEGDRYKVGKINVHIEGENTHTRFNTVLNRLGFRPGDVVNTQKIRNAERRLKASNLFVNDPSKGQVPKISFNPPDDAESVRNIAGRERDGMRGQSPDDDLRPLDVTVDAALTPEARRQLPELGPSQLQPPVVELPALPSAPPASAARSQQARLGVPATSHPQSSTVGRPPVEQRRQSGAMLPPARPDSRGASDQRRPRVPVRFVSERRPAADEFVWVPGQGWVARPAKSSHEQVNPYADLPLGGKGVAGQAATKQPLRKRSSESQQDADRWIIRGQSPYGGQPMQPISPTPQAGGAYQQPGAYSGSGAASVMPGGGPNPAQPGDPQSPGGPNGVGGPLEFDNPPPGWSGALAPPLRPLDMDPTVQETQTGRFTFGVGVNSNAGVVGSIVLDEQNFDIRRPPTSWQDFRDGTAWRGAGQHFRIEAAPGTQVSRYLVSITEPYLFDTLVSSSVSGSYYQRFFRDWTEERAGGRLSFGYQFRPDLSGAIAVRAEGVKIASPRVLIPDLAAVLGWTGLYGVKFSLFNDTRDNTFFPTEGRYIEVAFEQVFGTFIYPRGTLDMRKFFVMHQRADGSGRHVLSLYGYLGASGSNTPIYERFFMGGIGTMRGFYFRGASPVFNTVQVGGDFIAYSTVEYTVPITADDMFRAAAFVDFGVDSRTARVEGHDIRVAPGFGIRVNLPALGPAPISIDFSVPVVRNANDINQLVNFSMGVGR